MTDLARIREWISTFPQIDKLNGLKVDYCSTQLDNSSIAPAGQQEISRTEDILGNITVKNQYNFSLEFVFTKSPGDDVGATENADWVMEFQRWVQEQSIRKLVPTFGDMPDCETAKAQNGANTYADREGNGVYTVLLSINFTKYYEVSEIGKN